MSSTKRKKAAKAKRPTRKVKRKEAAEVRLDVQWSDPKLLHVLATEPRLVLRESWERSHALAVLLRGEPCLSSDPARASEVKVHNCQLGSDRLPVTVQVRRSDDRTPVLCCRRVSRSIWWVTLRRETRANRYEWRDAGDAPVSARGTVDQICAWLGAHGVLAVPRVKAVRSVV